MGSDIVGRFGDAVYITGAVTSYYATSTTFRKSTPAHCSLLSTQHVYCVWAFPVVGSLV